MSEQPIWTPSQARIEASRMTAFQKAVEVRWNKKFDSYALLHRWSIDEPAEFWRSVWEFCNVIGDAGETVLRKGDRMPGARWFPEARLNFAENLLRRRGEGIALVFHGEDRVARRITHKELHARVAHLAAALRASGIEAGDRVAAFIPNMPEAVLAMLAAASIGAVFSSCSPDFGAQGVLDRFGQISPKILFAADRYFYNGKMIDLRSRLAGIVASLPSVERAVIVPYESAEADLSSIRNARWFEDFTAPHAGTRDIEYERLPFDHPLYIMYSSGTTGMPKCIVHGAGGTLLQHLKEHQLHGDLHEGDRLFYFTTCGWMMWNWLVSGLASGASLILYDGSPFVGEGRILFDYADAEAVTHFGTSAKFIDALAKTSLRPHKTHRLDALRTIFSTGSPLAAEGFDFVYEQIKPDVNLASISGGTDIISCFVLGNPILPVWRGEIQCKGLGMAVEVFDEDGRSIESGKGDLVCTRPFPSMPIEFWNDPDGAKYRAAYFEKFSASWAMEITPS